MVKKSHELKLLFTILFCRQSSAGSKEKFRKFHFYSKVQEELCDPWEAPCTELIFNKPVDVELG